MTYEAPAPLVLVNADHVGLLAAELVLNRLCARPHARLLLPTGRTPGAMYGVLRAHAAAGRVPEGAHVLQLDEYAGIAPDDPRSFAFQLREALKGVPLASLATLDGAASDLDAEAARHEALTDGAPIDLAVLGLGRDGHVAFDGPPARLASGVRRVALAPETRSDAAAAFGGLDGVPASALTVGFGMLERTRELLLLVTGAAKAPALQAMLEEPVSDACPASLLRDHARLTVICDRDAASMFTPRPQFGSDRVVVVLGHRDPGISPEHRISFQSRLRLRVARRLAEHSPASRRAHRLHGDGRALGGRADEVRLGRARGSAGSAGAWERKLRRSGYCT
jgi:glucosamine-6-phosphate deaminase